MNSRRKILLFFITSGKVSVQAQESCNLNCGQGLYFGQSSVIEQKFDKDVNELQKYGAQIYKCFSLIVSVENVHRISDVSRKSSCTITVCKLICNKSTAHLQLLFCDKNCRRRIFHGHVEKGQKLWR